MDLALSAAAFSAMVVDEERIVKGIVLLTHKSGPDTPLSQRLGDLAGCAVSVVREATSKARPLLPAGAFVRGIRKVGVEDFARGFPFMREEMGMVVGAVRAAIYREFEIEVETIPVRAAKIVACPRWPGLNKDNWLAAGRTTKFKASMPDKSSIVSGLQRRYKIKARNDHEADACCVAISLARKHGRAI